MTKEERERIILEEIDKYMPNIRDVCPTIDEKLYFLTQRVNSKIVVKVVVHAFCIGHFTATHDLVMNTILKENKNE